MSSPAKTESNPATPQNAQDDTTNIDKDEDSSHVVEELVPDERLTAYNPCVSEEDNDDSELSRIKGDAIGDTLYSERFVLSILLKLTKLESDSSVDEQFENDLCALWDMTIEEDVVKLLLEHNVLELFAQCIEVTQDKRLTEILVGIVGNMCNMPLAQKELCERTEIIATLLQLISCSDALTLIQLMRLLTVAHSSNDSSSAELWYKEILLIPSFVEDFSFILQNSVNTSLLTQALEALDSIIANFDTIKKDSDAEIRHTEIFVSEALICGTIEAFKLLAPPSIKNETQNNSEFIITSQPVKRTVKVFLDIHGMLLTSNSSAKEVYQPHMTQLISILAQILEPLCFPDYLFPITMNEQVIFENINEIFLGLGDPYDDNCLNQMITIWELVQKRLVEDQKRPPPANDFEADEDYVKGESEEILYGNEICETILYFLLRTVGKAVDKQLDELLYKQSPRTILKLIDALNANEELVPIKDYVKECTQRLNQTFERLDRTVYIENGSVETK